MGSLLRVIPLNRMVCFGHDKPSCIGPLRVLGQNLFGVAILANNEYGLGTGWGAEILAYLRPQRPSVLGFHIKNFTIRSPKMKAFWV